MVVDALSRKSLHVYTLMVRELDLLEDFRDFILACDVTPNSVRLGALKIASKLLGESKEGHKSYPFLKTQLEAIALVR